MFTPHYAISPPLLDTIKRVTLLVHDLNRRPFPGVVLTQLLQEARAVSTYASTSIEGNPLPLTEVRRILKERPAHARQSEQEVLNYNAVLADVQERPDAPFDRDLILSIHQGVTKGLLPDHQSGRLRQEAVVVYEPRTGDVVYLPPDYQDVPPLLDDLITFVQANRATLDPLILAGLFHKQFVVIHPFMDGNGRTARLATNVLLAGLGLATFSLFSFENYYNQNVTRYFQHVGISGNYYDVAASLDFTPWLEYFAAGVLDELRRVQKQLERQPATPADALQPYHQAILDFIDARGFIIDRDYAGLTGRAKATRSLDFKKLIAMGLITRQGRGRATYYQRS